ncbi:CPBP family intramembrane glutamic endopeptidase [Microbacterium sp. gxy059]|uniref:CPBP family intramembrane glutamic endopeptidase n=1 Tax=Microbacterium sp. gxy059 TaxID=2957199 RepID=UPI003D9773DC
MTSPASPSPVPRELRVRLAWEVGIVLFLSIGKQAVLSVLQFARALTREERLADQTAALNPVRADAAAWDAVFRVANVFFDLCLVALVVYLLWEPGRSALRRIGLDLRGFGRDLGVAVLLVAGIGIPGLALYAGSRVLGLTVQVEAAAAVPSWMIPLLLLSALRAGLLEEVILNGYLVTRLEQLAWSPWRILAGIALLRGLYHLYQGPAMAAGNVVMGIVFGLVFLRTRRVMPLVIAHALIDAIAFVGYPLAAPFLP